MNKQNTVPKIFLNSYLSCALWSSTDETGEPLDSSFDVWDFSEKARNQAEAELADFLAYLEAENISTDGLSWEQMGHDFWLTRNHHGAGFWDRGLGEQGKALTDAAHTFGSSDCYVGDDGQVYLS